MSRLKSELWKPILSPDGKFYCSPACGGGTFCRKEWFDDATKQAAEMAAALGDGWEPHVHENMGWHASAVHGIAKVLYHGPIGKGQRTIKRDEPYSAWIEAPQRIFSGTFSCQTLQVIETGKTPAEAWCNVREKAKKMVATMFEATAAIGAAIGEPATENLRLLLGHSEDDFGVNGVCADEPDGEPVWASVDGKAAITFGLLRRARKELNVICGEPAPTQKAGKVPVP